jgi:hypothetical protein
LEFGYHDGIKLYKSQIPKKPIGTYHQYLGGEGGIVIMVGKLTKILQVPLDSASCTKPPPEFIGYLEVVDVHTHTHTHT